MSTTVPISALPAAGALSGSELTVIVQGGVTSKSTIGDAADFATSQVDSAFIVGALGYTPLSSLSNYSGRTKFTSTGIPVGGEPNEFEWNTTGSTALSGNNYGLRASGNYESDQDNSLHRLGALLGVMNITAGNTGNLGYSYGVYGVAYKNGSGIVTRNYGGHFIGSNKGAGSVTINAAATFQTEAINAATGTNFGILIHSPIITGTGAVTTNYGVFIESQNGAGVGAGYALYQAGASDNNRLEGNLIVDGTAAITGAVTVTTSVQSPSLIGGSLISSGITYKSTTANGTPSGVAHLFTGGNNGATTLLTIRNDGSVIIPNNRTILGVDSSGSNQTLLNWSSGDNITIQGRQGSTDITINPTTTSKGLTIKSQGRVGFFGTPSPTAYIHIGAGAAGAANAPLKFTTGPTQTTAEAGTMEYNNTFHLTNSDATRRHIVLAPNTTKVTAAAPYTNDGYVVVNIGGTDFKLMTTA